MKPPLTQRKWFYPLIYFLLVFISFLPLYTERPYDPRDTQQVIFEIISRAALPYAGGGVRRGMVANSSCAMPARGERPVRPGT